MILLLSQAGSLPVILLVSGCICIYNTGQSYLHFPTFFPETEGGSVMKDSVLNSSRKNQDLSGSGEGQAAVPGSRAGRTEDTLSGRFPMSAMELMLKEVFSARGFRSDTVFSNSELAEYITWLMRSFGGAVPAAPEDLPGHSASSKILGIVEEAASHPEDSGAMNRLAESFAVQDEEKQLLAGFDINVWRMFRYMPAHWHDNDYFELYYCSSGSCPVLFRGETVVMKPGSALILAPGILHATPCYKDDAVLLYYNIRATTFDRVFWGQLPSGDLMTEFFRGALTHRHHAAYLHFETGADPEIERLLGRIYDEYMYPEEYSAQMINALMSVVFVLLLRRYEGTARLPRTGSFRWRREFSAILTFIQSNYPNAGLSDVAHRFGYSERQITRIIREITGDSYANLVMQLRMRRAAELLGRGVSPEAAAAAAGYENLSSFYRSFARYYHCTPGEFVRRAESTGDGS